MPLSLRYKGSWEVIHIYPLTQCEKIRAFEVHIMPITCRFHVSSIRFGVDFVYFGLACKKSNSGEVAVPSKPPSVKAYR